MMMSMRKDSGEITSDREDILKICADFYKSLYTKTMPTPESTMKSSPDTEEISEFTEEEVEMVIKRMKRHKAQGIDGITSDIIKPGPVGGGGGGGGGEANRPHLPNKHLQ